MRVAKPLKCVERNIAYHFCETVKDGKNSQSSWGNVPENWMVEDGR